MQHAPNFIAVFLFCPQEIDLKDNNLKTIEEIISFQHLHRLVCLKLWYNQIAYIPIQIGTLTNLERLYLNRNKIEKIPAQLFFCRKLRYLDLSHNNLISIPPDIGFLQNLQSFAVTANRVSRSQGEDAWRFLFQGPTVITSQAFF